MRTRTVRVYALSIQAIKKEAAGGGGEQSLTINHAPTVVADAGSREEAERRGLEQDCAQFSRAADEVMCPLLPDDFRKRHSWCGD